MAERFTQRPQRARDDGSPSAELARALRDEPPALDEVTRARMERNVLEAWRMQGAASVALPRPRRASRSVRVGRGFLAASIAASAIVGGLLALQMSEPDAAPAVAVGSGRFELRIGQAATQSGTLSEGQVLESGAYGVIDVDLGSARVQMAKATQLRFDRMSASELRMSLQHGRVEVDFHPVKKGGQRMLIASAAADVRVIGTRFAVEVDALGATHVKVHEGVVEVAPRSGADPMRVSAGERVDVAPNDDSTERAVRDALAAQLGDTGELPDGAHVDMAFGLDEELPSVALPGAGPSVDARASRRLDAARKLLRQGRHGAARERLRGLADGPAALRFRVEALTLIAESFTAQGDIRHASDAYQRADALAPRHPAGHNARFAHARLLERYARDTQAASKAYRRYLERAPAGALASQARQALCRLGSREHCL